MRYEKIDAFKNDCMLFFKKSNEKTRCDICNETRYKEQKDPAKDLPLFSSHLEITTSIPK